MDAKEFNGTLKKKLKEVGITGISVKIINSYKFPHCWVDVYKKDFKNDKFSNEFRLQCYDVQNKSRNGLLDVNDVSCGTIRSSSITLFVHEWAKLFDIDM